MFGPLSELQQQFAANTVQIRALCCQNFKLRRQQKACNLNMPITVDCVHFFRKEKNARFENEFPSFLFLLKFGRNLARWVWKIGKEKKKGGSATLSCWSIAQLGGLELKRLATTGPERPHHTDPPNPPRKAERGARCSAFPPQICEERGKSYFLSNLCLCLSAWGSPAPGIPDMDVNRGHMTPAQEVLQQRTGRRNTKTTSLVSLVPNSSL